MFVKKDRLASRWTGGATHSHKIIFILSSIHANTNETIQRPSMLTFKKEKLLGTVQWWFPRHRNHCQNEKKLQSHTENWPITHLHTLANRKFYVTRRGSLANEIFRVVDMILSIVGGVSTTHFLLMTINYIYIFNKYIYNINKKK